MNYVGLSQGVRLQLVIPTRVKKDSDQFGLNPFFVLDV